MKIQLSAVAGGLLFAAQAFAHPAEHKMKVQLGSSAAFDSHGVLWLVSRDDTGQDGFLVARTSADEGRSWSSPAVISREPVVASGDERPRIAFGPHDEVYISYSRPLAQPYASEVRLVHSEDGGKHFSPPYTVQHGQEALSQGFASLAVDAVGRVYVTWIDKRNPQGAAQYYAVSSDAGRSFGHVQLLANNSCECCRSAIALAPGGQPVLMWRQVFPPNVRDHAVAVLAADGKPAVIERASFDNWAIDACPHQGPSIAFDGEGRRHQTWFTSDGLYYASQTPSGEVGAPMRFGSGQAGYADVAASGRQVGLVWKEFDGQATTIKALSSLDGGNSWTARTLASTRGASDQPRLANKAGRLFLVWHTDLNDIITEAL